MNKIEKLWQFTRGLRRYMKFAVDFFSWLQCRERGMSGIWWREKILWLLCKSLVNGKQDEKFISMI